jgi:hypothetical protein
MNFNTEFIKGQSGGNKGLPMGEGLNTLSKALNGVQKRRVYTVGSAPKTGKSTFVDAGFIIEPWLYCIENNIPIHFTYFSFEIDRVAKEFDFAAYFLYKDFNIFEIFLPEGITVKKSNKILLSPDYLRGRVLDDNENIVLVNDHIKNLLKIVYEKRIIPLFGEYDENNQRLSKGYMDFVRDKDNPTGLFKYLMDYAALNGTFHKSEIATNARTTSYKPVNEEIYEIVIVDHVRKLLPERGFNKKETVDKWSDYSIDLRDICGFTIVNIIHTNRNITSQDRMRFAKDQLYPTSDDIKDTANLSEDSDYVITLFNPNDEKYNLKEHFGVKIKDDSNNQLFPNLRTIHLVESRHCYYPQHFKVDMLGNVKSFKTLII